MTTDARYREAHRLLTLPRHQPGSTYLLGPELKFVDGRSCALQHLVMFEKKIYATSLSGRSPRIIDAGANIGMATIFFKRTLPDAKIIAFEADPNVAEVLASNVASFNLENVEIKRSAVSDKRGTMTFMPDGSDGGRLSEAGLGGVQVETVRLRDWLQEPVSLLKLDVEGAETDIILDCRDLLHNVEQLFVEYHSFAHRKQMLPEILEILRASGFRILVQTDYCGPSPLLEQPTHSGMDLRLNIFGVRPSQGAYAI